MVKRVDWDHRDRMSKLAQVMYPNLSDRETQREMAQLSANQGKKSPMQGRIDAEKARLAGNRK